MLLHHLPLSRPAYMDLTWWHWARPSSAPSAGWAASVGHQQGWGWVLGAECPGSLLWNPKCGVLLPRWGLACPVSRCHLICTHTQSTGAVLLSRAPSPGAGAISCPLGELLWREEELSTSGRQEYWQFCIYGRISEEMKKFGEADEKFWGQFTIQSETRNAWLICLFTLRSLQSASFQMD